MRTIDLESDKQKLKRLRNKIMGMKESKEKALLINNYRIYSHYLYLRTLDQELIDRKDEFEECLSYQKYMRSFFQDEKDLEQAVGVLGEIFEELGKFNIDEGVNQYIEVDKRIEPKLGKLLMEEFFVDLSPYIYKIYKEVMDGSISYLGDAYSLDVAYYDSPKVVSYDNMKSYETYKAIVHEIGHCYQFIINAKSSNKYFDQLDVEMVAIFMETIFNLFVDDKLYNQCYGLNSLLRRQSLMAYTGRVHDLLLNRCEMNWITARMVFGDISYDQLTDRDIQLLEEVSGYEFIKREGDFTFSTELNTFKYTIGNFLALNFVDIYLQDKKEGLRMLKDYIMLPPSVSLRDKLEDYKIDSYKRINRLVYEYGRRIHRI